LLITWERYKIFHSLYVTVQILSNVKRIQIHILLNLHSVGAPMGHPLQLMLILIDSTTFSLLHTTSDSDSDSDSTLSLSDSDFVSGSDLDAV
jgi:hypothetical protein